MEKQIQLIERDREATEKRLLETIGKIVADSGFEKIGINAVAAQSGVSKILIYRYFGSVEGLMAAYIRQHDFWINFPHKIPDRKRLPDFIKKMFREQISQLRSDPTLRRLHRWELSSNNEMLATLRKQREKTGIHLIEVVSRLTDYPKKEIATMASILTSSITYLVMLEEFCPLYNGIHLDRDNGWKQVSRGVDALIDMWFDCKKKR